MIQTDENGWGLDNYGCPYYSPEEIEAERKSRIKDRHLGCYSYPNCAIDRNGCSVYSKTPEQYGHRN